MSVAFGAPIGGVLFSLEQVSYYFPDKVMWHSFVCAMIAAVSLQAMNPFRTGKLVLWQISYDRNWHDFEVVSFILIGVLGVHAVAAGLMKGDLRGYIPPFEHESRVLEKTLLDKKLPRLRSSYRVPHNRNNILPQHIHTVPPPGLPPP
jgi:Voltage gated chloride channel